MKGGRGREGISGGKSGSRACAHPMKREVGARVASGRGEIEEGEIGEAERLQGTHLEKSGGEVNDCPGVGREDGCVGWVCAEGVKTLGFMARGRNEGW